MVPHLTDVVAAGGSDGLVDHLLTHDAVECLLDTTQQTSLSEENNANDIYSTMEYSIQYCNIVAQYQEYTYRYCVFSRKYYRIHVAGNFRGAKFRGFRGLTLDHEYYILPTNEVTLPTFTCSASSYHEYINILSTK